MQPGADLHAHANVDADEVCGSTGVGWRGASPWLPAAPEAGPRGTGWPAAGWADTAGSLACQPCPACDGRPAGWACAHLQAVQAAGQAPGDPVAHLPEPDVEHAGAAAGPGGWRGLDVGAADRAASAGDPASHHGPSPAAPQPSPRRVASASGGALGSAATADSDQIHDLLQLLQIGGAPACAPAPGAATATAGEPAPQPPVPEPLAAALAAASPGPPTITAAQHVPSTPLGWGVVDDGQDDTPLVSRRGAGPPARQAEPAPSPCSPYRSGPAAQQPPPPSPPPLQQLAPPTAPPPIAAEAAPCAAVRFAAIFLTADSRDVLLGCVPPCHAAVRADHMTLAFQPSWAQLLALPLGAEVDVTIIGSTADARVQVRGALQQGGARLGWQRLHLAPPPRGSPPATAVRQLRISPLLHLHLHLAAPVPVAVPPAGGGGRPAPLAATHHLSVHARHHLRGPRGAHQGGGIPTEECPAGSRPLRRRRRRRGRPGVGGCGGGSGGGGGRQVGCLGRTVPSF